MGDNNDEEKLVLDLSKENYSITNDESNTGFKINEVDSKNIHNNTLEIGKAIKLVGTFNPEIVGKRSLITTLKFKEGQEIKLSSETEVIQVQLNVSLEQPNDPLKFALNSDQEMVFLVSNTSGLDATKITIELITDLLKDVSIVKEKLINKAYEGVGDPKDIVSFNKDDNNLDTSERLRVTGKLKTDKVGEKTLGILVKYRESETFKNDTDKLGAKLEKNITIVGVTIVGKIEPKLPPKIKLGGSYVVTFIFTNESSEFSATELTLEVKQDENIK